MGDVVSIFNWNGGTLSDDSDDEVMLGTPDSTEAQSLPHHVERCAMRYRLFTRRQATQGADIAQIKYMILGLIGIMLITSPQIRAMAEWISKIL